MSRSFLLFSVKPSAKPSDVKLISSTELSIVSIFSLSSILTKLSLESLTLITFSFMGSLKISEISSDSLADSKLSLALEDFSPLKLADFSLFIFVDFSLLKSVDLSLISPVIR